MEESRKDDEEIGLVDRLGGRGQLADAWHQEMENLECRGDMWVHLGPCVPEQQCEARHQLPSAQDLSVVRERKEDEGIKKARK
jgi:hypothetical protein